MPETSITCPSCKKKIPLTQALTQPIVDQMKRDFQADIKKKDSERASALNALESDLQMKFSKERAAIQTKVKNEAKTTYSKELEDLKLQVGEKEKLIEEARTEELSLRKRERTLTEKQKSLELDTQRQIDNERDKIRKQATEEALDSQKNAVANLKVQLEEKSDQVAKARNLEADILQRERNLKEREESMQLELQKKLDLEREIIGKKAAETALANQQMELGDLKNQLNEKRKQLETAQENELALRARQRTLEEKEKALDLEVNRQLDEQRSKIWDQAAEKFSNDHKLKEREKEKQLSDMRQQIEDLKRKADQGSQQMQGEVQELELESMLREAFPVDKIDAVKQGARGADILHVVTSQSGRPCGTIIWESKRTKAWSDGWIKKLKEDQREEKAEIGVIVTAVLPKNLNHFGQIDGVWITDFQSLVGLAMALRDNLANISQLKSALTGKGEKMDLIYNYLSGLEFRHRIQAIVEAFTTMQQDLESEKRSAIRGWAKREKQIQSVVHSTSGMYGDLQALIGASLPNIELLEHLTGPEDPLKSSENKIAPKDELPL